MIFGGTILEGRIVNYENLSKTRMADKNRKGKDRDSILTSRKRIQKTS